MIVTKSVQKSPFIRAIITVVATVITVFLIISSVRMFYAYRYAHNRLVSTRINNEKTNKQYQELKNRYSDVTTVDGMEYYVRDQYRAIAAGEELIVLVDDENTTNQKPKKEENQEVNKKTIKQRLASFFGL